MPVPLELNRVDFLQALSRGVHMLQSGKEPRLWLHQFWLIWLGLPVTVQTDDPGLLGKPLPAGTLKMLLLSVILVLLHWPTSLIAFVVDRLFIHQNTSLIVLSVLLLRFLKFETISEIFQPLYFQFLAAPEANYNQQCHCSFSRNCV